MTTEAQALAAYLETTASASPLPELERSWSRPALRSALRSGRVVRLLPSTYAAQMHAHAFRTRSSAVWHWTNATIIGTAACHHYGLLDPPESIEVATWAGQRPPEVPWLRVTRVGYDVPSLEPPQGPPLRVATPAFAVVTAFHRLDADAGEQLVYRAVQRLRLSAAQLTRAVEVVPRVRGRRRLESLIAAVAAGSESHLETRGLRTVFHTREFARFIRQHEVVVEGALFRLDMYDPATMTSVELDGGTHAQPRQREKDIARDAALASTGVLTMRFSWSQITREPERCRALVRAVLLKRT